MPNAQIPSAEILALLDQVATARKVIGAGGDSKRAALATLEPGLTGIEHELAVAAGGMGTNVRVSPNGGCGWTWSTDSSGQVVQCKDHALSVLPVLVGVGIAVGMVLGWLLSIWWSS